jgi:hypothetical protein
MEEKLFEKRLISFVEQNNHLVLKFNHKNNADFFLNTLRNNNLDYHSLWEIFLNNQIDFISMREFCNQIIISYKYLSSINSKKTWQEKNAALEELSFRNSNFSEAILSWADVFWGNFFDFTPNMELINKIGWNGITFIKSSDYMFGKLKFYKYLNEEPYYETVIKFKELGLAKIADAEDSNILLDSFSKEDLSEFFSIYTFNKSISKKDLVKELCSIVPLSEFAKFRIHPDFYFRFLDYRGVCSMDEVLLHYAYFNHKSALTNTLLYLINKFRITEKLLRLSIEYKEDNFYYLNLTAV